MSDPTPATRSANTPPSPSSSGPRAPDAHDAVATGAALEGYAAAAPTDAHLGWTPAQVQARTGGQGRPLADVKGAVETNYGVPERGLNKIPNEVFSDSRIRNEQYLKPLEAVPSRFTPTDPAALKDPAAWRDAARSASDFRNATMETVRAQMSEKGLGASTAAKPTAPTFEQTQAKAESTLIKDNPAAFEGMSPAEREIAISKQVIKSAGQSDPSFDAIVKGADESALGLKTLKYGGRALMVVGAVVDGASIVNEARTSMQTGDWRNTEKQTAKVAGGWLGAAAAGAAVGAVSGTIVPGLGNVAGFVIGAAAGIFGYWAGSQLGEASFTAATGY